MSTGQKLRGFVGQAMSGRRAKLTPQVFGHVNTTSTGAGSTTVTAPCWALIGILGAGEGGSNVGSGEGGDGGDAAFSLVRVNPGWTISWSIGTGGTAGSPGTAGGDTTVTLPGYFMRAKGGGSSAVSIGHIIRKGGVGGAGSVDGAAGEDGGGTGGDGDGGGGGGGGGAAGLTSKLPGFTFAGNGTNGNSGPTAGIGAGGGGNSLGGAASDGGSGRVVILLVESL